MLRLAEEATGGRYAVRVGEEVLICLVENPTTGFRWQLITSTSDVLRQQSDWFEGSEASRIGGGGRRTFRLLALRPGSVEVSAWRGRRWERTTPAGDSPMIRYHVAVLG